MEGADPAVLRARSVRRPPRARPKEHGWTAGAVCGAWPPGVGAPVWVLGAFPGVSCLSTGAPVWEVGVPAREVGCTVLSVYPGGGSPVWRLGCLLGVGVPRSLVADERKMLLGVSLGNTAPRVFHAPSCSWSPGQPWEGPSRPGRLASAGGRDERGCWARAPDSPWPTLALATRAPRLSLAFPLPRRVLTSHSGRQRGSGAAVSQGNRQESRVPRFRGSACSLYACPGLFPFFCSSFLLLDQVSAPPPPAFSGCAWGTLRFLGRGWIPQ